jgi:DNA-binding MarR family transcriptional regulator
MRTPRVPRSRISAADYQTLADLRYHIRRFLRIREVAARTAGLEPQHYLLLLQIKGLEGRSQPSISRLAERLQIRHHSAVELIDRLVDRDLVARRSGDDDRRQVLIELRPAGEAVLRRLAEYSIRELRSDGPALLDALGRLIGERARRRSRRGKPGPRVSP